jgi:hypothetical protein
MSAAFFRLFASPIRKVRKSDREHKKRHLEYFFGEEPIIRPANNIFANVFLSSIWLSTNYQISQYFLMRPVKDTFR